MEPEKRLSLPEWQDKIAIKYNYKDFNDLIAYTNANNSPSLNIEFEELKYEALEELHKQEIAFLQSQIPQWVSVEERLPGTHCDVWVRKKTGKCYLMSYHAPFDSGKRIFQWWAFGKWLDQHSQVTHWMPLPQPPTN